MGSAVSFNRQDKSESKEGTIGEKKQHRTFAQPAPILRSTTNNNSDSPPSPNNPQLRMDLIRSRCEDSGNNDNDDDFPGSPFIIRSAISNRSTFTTPPRTSSPRSLASSSSQNHHSGPNSIDSRTFPARDAVDFLYRRTQLSENNSPVDNPSETGSAADIFAATAMSLGLDNDDLLFNMMFFDDGSLPNFGSIMNTMQQETLALHSENNTPYKLNPANEKAISHLIQEKFQQQDSNADNECSVCKDEIDHGADIIRIPTCRHYFHAECLSRWIQLQAWCPVCRSSLEPTNLGEADDKTALNTVKTLRFDTEEKDACGYGCCADPVVEDRTELKQMQHDVASNSAEKFIVTGLGRAVNRELSSAKEYM